MATTLTSAIVDIDVSRLKRSLEALGDIRVVSITPPKGVILTTVVLTRGDKISDLTGPQQIDAQAVIDAHIDYFDESVQEVSQTKATFGTIEAGTVDFVNDGLAWQIGPDKNLVPVGLGRKLGSVSNPISVLYVSTIVGAGGGGGGGSQNIYNEVPSGSIDGVNTVFTTAVAFVSVSTRVFVNGLRLVPGASKSYEETDVNEITLTFAPESGDEIYIDYEVA